MRGVRAEQSLEPKAGGAFLASLLVHGVVIAGIASIPALRPGLPHPDPIPMMLMFLPAPDAMRLEDRELGPESGPEPAPQTVAASAPEVMSEPIPGPIVVPPPPFETPPVETPSVAIPAPRPAPPHVMATPPLTPPLPEVLPHPEPPRVLPIPPKPTVVAEKPVPRKPAPKAVAPIATAPAAPVAEPSTIRVSSLSDAPTPVPAAPAAPVGAALPLITEAQYRERVPPVFPPRAAALNQQGEALVRVRVGPDGEQEEILLWRSSGFALLDRAALTAVRRSRFEPFRHNGTALAAWVEVPVHFTLN